MSIKHLYPTSTPALNLNPKSSRVADPRLSCVRNSIGTYVDPVSGLIKTAPANVARVDKDGLLVEESRTNSIANSAVFSSGYGKSNVTPTDNVATAPDGTTTAASLMETGGTGFHNFYQAEITSGAAGNYAQSIFVKANGRANVNLRWLSVSVSNCWHTITFTLTGDGAITQEQSGSGANFTSISRSIEHIGNGWYRITLGASNPNARIYPLILDGSDSPTPTLNSQYGVPSYTGDTAKGYYIWGAQWETGTFATSYIPTSGSTVQRLADQITLTNSGIFDPNENTIINEDFGVAGGSDTLTVFGDGSKAERTFVYSSHLSQEQFNTLAGVDDWWEWRVLGSSYAFPNLSADGQVTVDWGDGTVETLTTSEHTFTNGSGYHTIRIKQENGTYLYLSPSPTERPKLISIGPVPTSINVWGQYLGFLCPNLETFDAHGANYLNAIYINSGSPKLKSTPYADYSSVTNFSYCWNGASGLTRMPHIDTSNGTVFTGCWWNCSGLKEFPALDFSSSSSNGLRYAWNGCSSLTSFPLITLGSATNLEATWTSNANLTSFPLLDTSGVTNFSQTWYNCVSLASFPAIDTSNGTNFYRAWCLNTSLVSFPGLDFSSGTTFREAWYQDAALTTFPPNMFNTTGTLATNAFSNAWRNCALTAQSIENILVSLDANNATGIQLGIQGGTNAAKTTWSTAANNAYNNLVTKSWSITFNP